VINVVTQPTPNPATMKFLPGCAVMADGTADFPSRDTADRSPLAARLFGLEGVAGVFLGADFVSVAKHAADDWDRLAPPVAREIEAHFESGAPAVEAGVAAEEDAAGDPVAAQIRELIDTRIRPSIAQDGGDIVFRGFEDGIVRVSLQGACVGCPSSSATLKMGVENLLKFYVPDVTGVEAVQ
jgi:Fe-S cluster biogenesis protein NfuA